MLRFGLVFCLVLLITACQSTSFADKFDQVKPGQSRSDVSAALGEPAEINQHEMPEGLFSGPSEGLISELEPGAPFEEWIYRQDGQDYYIWFASDSGEPQENWQVTLTANYPEGAVF